MTARKSSRVKTRSNTNALTISSFAPQEVRPPLDPVPVEYSIKVSKRIQLQVTVGSSGNFSVDPSMLSAGVPGGLTYWNRMRIDAVYAYGDSAGSAGDDHTISIQASNSTDWDQPSFNIRDTGTLGQSRPRVGFRLALLDRARWFGTAGTTELCVVNAPTDSIVTLQATIELMSPGA
jgi:hypothetical protein